MAYVIIKIGEKLFVKAKVYQNILLLAKGLRFSSPLKNKQGLLLASPKEDLGAIDMHFVFFPIDVVWLDKNKKIIHIARKVQPFTPYVAPPKKAQYILECQANSTNHLKVKDKLSFVIHQ
ncbi:MAG: DUF192 domain-containing protein [Candidatus Woesearchaeota archaeon]|nr:DUF192 domain-containing protein [Candidatus Woesearchaeota archaeon]